MRPLVGMADSDIPEVREETRREPSEDYSDARVRSAFVYMLAVALLMAVAYLLLR